MDMENVDEAYKDDILESGAYDNQIESMVNTLSHFNQESWEAPVVESEDPLPPP